MNMRYFFLQNARQGVIQGEFNIKHLGGSEPKIRKKRNNVVRDKKELTGRRKLLQCIKLTFGCKPETNRTQK